MNALPLVLFAALLTGFALGELIFGRALVGLVVGLLALPVDLLMVAHLTAGEEKT